MLICKKFNCLSDIFKILSFLEDFMFLRKVFLCLSIPLFLNATELSINIDLKNCQEFVGDYSLSPEEIYYSLKHTTYIDNLKILELCAGDDTVRICNILQSCGIPYQYTTFEIDPELDFRSVIFRCYPLPSNEILDLSITDLVIINGYYGFFQCDMFAKIKHLIRHGTIILIDDFHHYKEFG
jgi:hypothetical protein